MAYYGAVPTSPARYGGYGYGAPVAPIAPSDKYKYQADQRRRVLDQNRQTLETPQQYPAGGYYDSRAAGLYGGYDLPYGGNYLRSAGYYPEDEFRVLRPQAAPLAGAPLSGAPLVAPTYAPAFGGGSSILRSGRYIDDGYYGGGYYGGLPLARDYISPATVVPTSGAPVAASQYTYSRPAALPVGYGGYGAGYGYPYGGRVIDDGAYIRGGLAGGYYGAGAGRIYGDYIPSSSIYRPAIAAGPATVTTSGAPVATSQYTYSRPAGLPLGYGGYGAGYPISAQYGARYIDDGYYGGGYLGGYGAPRIYGGDYYGRPAITAGPATVVPTSGALDAPSQYIYSRPAGALPPVTYGGVPLRGGFYGGGRYLDDIAYGGAPAPLSSVARLPYGEAIPAGAHYRGGAAPLSSVARLPYGEGAVPAGAYYRGERAPLAGRYYDDAYLAPRGDYGYDLPPAPLSARLPAAPREYLLGRERAMSPARGVAASGL